MLERKSRHKFYRLWVTDVNAVGRLALSALGLLSLFIWPPHWRQDFLLIFFALYMVWGLILCFRPALQQPVFAGVAQKWAAFIDLGAYFLLATFSDELHAIYTFGLLYAVFVATSRSGARTGFSTVVSAVVLGSTAEVIKSHMWGNTDLRGTLLQFALLLSLGWAVAWIGSYKFELQRRYDFLNDIMKFSNPRFGVDYMLDSMLRRLRAFYDADVSIIILPSADGSENELRRANRKQADVEHFTGLVAEALSRTLLCIPAEVAVTYVGKSKLTAGKMSRLSTFDILGQRESEVSPELCEEVATMLDADALLTVPVSYQGKTIGRLVIVNPAMPIKEADAFFLLHVLGQLMPVIENVRLVEQLAAHAAEHERQKLARDIHDSVIQPYIGFMLALNGIKRKLEGGATDTLSDLDSLLQLTEHEITELRSFTRGLSGAAKLELSLIAAARRFAAKFTATTGINVEVLVKSDIHIYDRLAAEVFQMIAEGLSNVRRHTTASRAIIELESSPEVFTLRVRNEGQPKDPAGFSPRSITERAAALGGAASVASNELGETILTITIPL